MRACPGVARSVCPRSALGRPRAFLRTSRPALARVAALAGCVRSGAARPPHLGPLRQPPASKLSRSPALARSAARQRPGSPFACSPAVCGLPCGGAVALAACAPAFSSSPGSPAPPASPPSGLRGRAAPAPGALGGLRPPFLRGAPPGPFPRAFALRGCACAGARLSFLARLCRLLLPCALPAPAAPAGGSGRARGLIAGLRAPTCCAGGSPGVSYWERPLPALSHYTRRSRLPFGALRP